MMALHLLPDFSEAMAAFLAHPALAVIGHFAVDADPAGTRRTIEQGAAGGDRHLLRESAALRILPRGSQVLVHLVHALDDNFVLARQHAQHATGRARFGSAGVVSGD